MCIDAHLRRGQWPLLAGQCVASHLHIMMVVLIWRLGMYLWRLSDTRSTTPFLLMLWRLALANQHRFCEQVVMQPAVKVILRLRLSRIVLGWCFVWSSQSCGALISNDRCHPSERVRAMGAQMPTSRGARIVQRMGAETEMIIAAQAVRVGGRGGGGCNASHGGAAILSKLAQSLFRKNHGIIRIHTILHSPLGCVVQTLYFELIAHTYT